EVPVGRRQRVPGTAESGAPALDERRLAVARAGDDARQPLGEGAVEQTLEPRALEERRRRAGAVAGRQRVHASPVLNRGRPRMSSARSAQGVAEEHVVGVPPRGEQRRAGAAGEELEALDERKPDGGRSAGEERRDGEEELVDE